MLEQGAAEPFLTHVIVEPYARFFPEAEAPGADPVRAVHQRIYSYAGLPEDLPALAFDVEVLGPGAPVSTDRMQLGPICRRAARAWRMRQGLASDDPEELDLTAVCLGLGALVANEELARGGLHGEARPQDPSTAWRKGPLAPGLGRLLAGLQIEAGFREPLTAAEVVFVLAAQVVVRHPSASARRGYGAWWRARTLARTLRPVFQAAVRELAEPRDALAVELGFRAPRERKRYPAEDGSLHPLDFDCLTGVDRVWAARRGVLGRLPGLSGERLRCSAPRCRAPLPPWLTRCGACGRPVRGDAE